MYLHSRPDFKEDLTGSVSLSTVRTYTCNILTCAGSTVSIPGEVDIAFLIYDFMHLDSSIWKYKLVDEIGLVFQLQLKE